MTVAELLERTSSAEIAEWGAYFNIVNEEKQKKLEVERYERWQHTASLCAIIANVNRAPDTEPYVMQDFIPVPYPGKESAQVETKEQTWEEQLQIIEILNAAMGGSDTRGVMA
jgi:hypothetical protein